MKTTCLPTLAIFLVSLISDSESVCLSRRTDWGQFGSFFTDPLCDVWCHVRRCGKGVCTENTMTWNKAYCVCQQCGENADGSLTYSDNDGIEQTQSRLYFDGRSTSSPSSSRHSNDLYPSQNRYNENQNSPNYNN